MQTILRKFKDFLNKKALGFYFSAAGAALAFVLLIAYLIGYAGSEYFFWGVPVLIALSFLTFAGLAAFDKTAVYAPVALSVIAFGALCCYLANIHVYLALAFTDGVSLEAIMGLSPAFFITVIFSLVITILGNIGIYMKQNKTVKTETSEKVEAEGVKNEVD